MKLCCHVFLRKLGMLMKECVHFFSKRMIHPTNNLSQLKQCWNTQHKNWNEVGNLLGEAYTWAYNVTSQVMVIIEKGNLHRPVRRSLISSNCECRNSPQP
eukprot:PhF_6_TR12875/c0_g1_i1/m.20246